MCVCMYIYIYIYIYINNISQGELRKLIRLYLERDIVHMKAAFEQNY